MTKARIVGFGSLRFVLFMFLGTFLIPSGNAVSQEMTTIERYMEQNNFNSNPGAAEHVFLRCASILLLAGGYLQQTPDLVATGKAFSDSGNEFLDLAARIPRFNQQFGLDQVNRMTDAYKERWLRAKAATGNFSDDPIIRSDIKTCMDITKASR